MFKKAKHAKKQKITVEEILIIFIFIMLPFLLQAKKINFKELVECVIAITKINKELVK